LEIVMSYQQVTERERYFISLALSQGVSKVSIARQLNRSRSTIQREFQRNRDRKGHYKPLIAHKVAEFRRLRISAEPAPCFGVNRQVISVSGGLLLGA
jgi:IS30 family transposase